MGAGTRSGTHGGPGPSDTPQKTLLTCAGGLIHQHVPRKLTWGPQMFTPNPALVVVIKIITDRRIWNDLCSSENPVQGITTI